MSSINQRRDGLAPETDAQRRERAAYGRNILRHNTRILEGWTRDQLLNLFCECNVRFVGDKLPRDDRLRALAPSLIVGKLPEPQKKRINMNK